MLKRKVRFFNKIKIDLTKERKPGDMMTVQIMRTGHGEHLLYGRIHVTDRTLNNVLHNFENRKAGVDLVVDENHEDDHKAMAIFRKMWRDGDALMCEIELTKKGATSLTNGEYFYFSPEIILGEHRDEETGEIIEDMLTGGAFTNRPFFKKMEPVMASEKVASKKNGQVYLYFCDFNKTMKKFKQLLEAAQNKSFLTFSEKNELIMHFNSLSDDEQKEVQTDLEAEVAKPGEEPKPSGGDGDNNPNDNVDPGKVNGDTLDDATKIQASQKKMTELEKEVLILNNKVRANEIEKKFSEKFACNQTNYDGLFNEATQKDQFISLYMSFNDEQAKMFDALIGGVDVTLPLKFKEIGFEAKNENKSTSTAEAAKFAGIADGERKFNEAAQRIAKEKNIPVRQATQLVSSKDLQ